MGKRKKLTFWKNLNILRIEKRRHNMINTVIFDLDGLLVNSEYTWYLVTKGIMAEYGYELTL